MRQERLDHTLQPTALVHEAYLRLFAGQQIDWKDHAHLTYSAARAMRQVLVDHARRRNRAKRGVSSTGFRSTQTRPLCATSSRGCYSPLTRP